MSFIDKSIYKIESTVGFICYLALPKRLTRDKNDVKVSPILPFTTSDGMNTEIALNTLNKKLGAKVCQRCPCSLLWITTTYCNADLVSMIVLDT